MSWPRYSVRGLLLATAGVAIVATFVPPKELVELIAKATVVVGLIALAIAVGWVWEQLTGWFK
jgi:hypothetical protein